MGFIPLYYLSYVAILAIPTLSLPTTLTDHAPTASNSLSFEASPLPSSASTANPTLSTGVSVAGIIFAAIGSTIGLIFLALFIRQAIAYYRLPRPDVTLTAARREQLLAEAEAASRRRCQPCPMPPPPYERAPPYESLEPRTE